MRVLNAPGDEDMSRVFAQKIANGDHSFGTKYGYAVALIQNNKASQAVPLLKQLIVRHGDLHDLYSTLGEAQGKSGDMKDALATFRLAMELFPHNVPVTIRYAQTLMMGHRNAEAHDVLLDLFNNIDPTPDQVELTARAASAAGDLGDAYYYMGDLPVRQRQSAARRGAVRARASQPTSDLRAAPANPGLLEGSSRLPRAGAPATRMI